MSTTVSSSAPSGSKRVLLYLLAALALAALAGAYVTPAWWVSLKAPNYPPETFPDGVRIHFHVDRVANGCSLRNSKEVIEKEALDCVHEMDTINHFVGMYPIASGGPVEKLFSPFMFAFIAVLIIGFVVPNTRLRLTVMAAGFGVIAVWMAMALYTPDGARYIGKGWVSGLVDSLGRSSDEADASTMHPVVKQLKESLAKSGISDGSAPKVTTDASKEQLLDILKSVHDAKQPVVLGGPPPKAWTGRAIDVMAWHYEESLGRWFNEPAKSQRLVGIMTTVAHLLFAALLIAMALFLWIAAKPRSVLFNLLALVAVILPIGFIAEYAGWLWWYGHSLNAMGAFTLKPFMPTVFGDGKVAQFSTHSYPAIGFALMLVVGAAMAAALLIRRGLPKT